MVKNITTVREVDLFCRVNIYKILQRKQKWIFPVFKCQLEEDLFIAASRYAGALNVKNFFKVTSKDKRKVWARNFDNAIRDWLNKFYDKRVHFTHVEEIIFSEETSNMLAQEDETTIEPEEDSCEFNRQVLYSECDELCSGDCGNKEVQEEGNTLWEDKMKIRFLNSSVGVGVVAKRTLFAGEYLGFVTGEGLSREEFTERQKDAVRIRYLFECASESEGGIICGLDPTTVGNHCRFFNHSCRPNCCFEIWTVSGRRIIKLRVLEENDIQAVS